MHIFSKYWIPVYVAVCITFVSCRKDDIVPIHVDVDSDHNFDPCKGAFLNYSTSDFEKNYVDIVQGAYEPQYVSQQDFANEEPLFNPDNPYEIVFARVDYTTPGFDNELWKFNFCTGELNYISNNCYYNLDYGRNGWLLYTGMDHQVYKVKDNGDSLTALTSEPGYNRAGSWSPNGSKYFSTRDNGIWVKDVHNNTVFSKSGNPWNPIEWIDEQCLLLNEYYGSFGYFSLNIQTGEVVSLNSQSWIGVAAYGWVYDRENNFIYTPCAIGDDGRYFLKYDLSSNTVDTVLQTTSGYQFKRGSYSPYHDKIITTLLRRKNASLVEVHFWNDLLIMNPDGTDQRLITIPQ